MSGYTPFGFNSVLNVPPVPKIKDLDDNSLGDDLRNAGDQLVVVHFTAKWCEPCKKITPFYENLSIKFPNVLFLRIDVDQCPTTASLCNIKSMPTFQFFKNLKLIDAFSGAHMEKLNSLVKKFSSTSIFKGDVLSENGEPFISTEMVLTAATLIAIGLITYGLVKRN